MVDIRKLETGSEQKSGIGAIVEVTSALYGMPAIKDRMRITGWIPPHRIEVPHEGQVTGNGAFMAEPVAGGTVFTWQEELRPPLGLVGETGFRLLVSPRLRKQFARSMDKLRRLAEGVRLALLGLFEGLLHESRGCPARCRTHLVDVEPADVA